MFAPLRPIDDKRGMVPQLRDLDYFLEVASAGSISRAAERLGLTQPSLTLAVQRLEGSLGVPLFVRSKSGVTLTPSGKCLAERAQRLRLDWQRLRDYVLAANDDVAGGYVLGCHNAVAVYTLPAVLPGLHVKYPRLYLRLLHDLSRKIVEATISMRVDLGIVINPVRHPDLVVRRISDEVVTLWRGPTPSPLQKCDDGSGVLLCDPEMLQTQALQQRLTKRAWRFERTLESSDLHLIAALVAAGNGIGVLPSSVALQYALKPLRGAPRYKDELCVIYRVEQKGTPAIQAMSKHILATLGETGPAPS